MTWITGAQGYWVCSVIATVSFCVLAGTNLIAAVLVFLLFYLGGVGVRQCSRYAATIVFAMFLLGTASVFRAGLSGGIVMRIIFLALLFSNARATWLASRWQADSEEARLPPRLGETWSEKFSNKLPTWLWPKVRYPYYVFSAGFLVLGFLGLLVRRVR